MPYGKALVDTVESSGNLAITGNTAITGNVTVSGALTSSSSTINLGTAVSTGSTNSVVLSTTIPSWAKRITVMVNGISTSSTNGQYFVRLGTNGSTLSTGYNSVGISTSSTVTTTAYTTGIYMGSTGTTAAAILRGKMYIDLMDSANNLWQGTTTSYRSGDADVYHSGFGQIALSGVLNTVELVVTAGNFDAGTVSISYE
jgi:hypothetical protein